MVILLLLLVYDDALRDGTKLNTVEWTIRFREDNITSNNKKEKQRRRGAHTPTIDNDDDNSILTTTASRTKTRPKDTQKRHHKMKTTKRNETFAFPEKWNMLSWSLSAWCCVCVRVCSRITFANLNVFAVEHLRVFSIRHNVKIIESALQIHSKAYCLQ